jgi:hypothetical protein
VKTDEQLKQLAKDIHSGLVFTNNHLPQDEPMLLGAVFMPLVMMNDEQQKDFTDKQPGMVYEYLDKAGPRSFNGFPMFMSFQFVTVDEYEKLRGFYEEIKAATPILQTPEAQ